MQLTRLGRGPRDLAGAWRTGSSRSQRQVLGLLLVGVGLCLAVSWLAYDRVPVGVFLLFPLGGATLLRFRPLLALTGATAAAAVAAYVHGGGPRDVGPGSVVVAAAGVAMVLWQSARQRSGLPAGLSEPMLTALRDRLQRQGRVPPLPEGWRSQSAMVTAAGTAYAGDFLVADLRDDRELELVLVDVCGKGTAVGPQALQFAGALGGLIGALPPEALLRAANAFLLRQCSEDAFATAVHVLVDLEDGGYRITSAGHPPALRWESAGAAWVVDNARGTALGVIPEPELEATTGVLAPGDALMFYTDGVIERRGSDLDAGVEWLREVGRREVVRRGFDDAARRVLAHVRHGDDDRAVLILSRS